MASVGRPAPGIYLLAYKLAKDSHFIVVTTSDESTMCVVCVCVCVQCVCARARALGRVSVVTCLLSET